MNEMICPFCHAEVTHGAAVCRGCQAEIKYNEPTFMVYVIGILIVFCAMFGLAVGIGHHVVFLGGIVGLAIGIGIAVAIAKSTNIKFSKEPRFYRHMNHK